MMADSFSENMSTHLLNEHLSRNIMSDFSGSLHLGDNMAIFFVDNFNI